MLPAWNPIQFVSCVHLLCLILIADVACMKSHPECELCAFPLLYFHCWHCMHEIPSSLWVVCISSAGNFDYWCCPHEIPFRLWVVCISSALFWLLTLPAWNPIQAVSRVHLLCFILIADVVCMKSHLVCELCEPPLLYFDGWHCLHEIPSSLWVVCITSAWFSLLILPAWNFIHFIQFVSCVHLLCLILIADVACMNSHPGCELCASPLLYFDCWCCLHEIPSRVWVVCTSSAWLPLLTSFAWNLI